MNWTEDVKPLKKKPMTAADLYPALSPPEQREADCNLRQYLALVWRIYQRTSREKPRLLTKTLREARLKRKNGDI